MRCVGCPISTLKPKIQYADPDVFSACLKNIDAKVELLRLFNFGEPMLHPQLPEMVKRVTNKVRCLEISTSGQFYDEGKIVETLKLGRLNRLCVSADGNGFPDEYERLRPPAKWDNLIYFMEKVKTLCDKYSPKVELVMRTINTGDPKVWKNICHRRGWHAQLRKWKRLPGSENHTGKTYIPAGLCKFFRGNKLYVDFDGTVVPCCRHPRAFVMGNLLEQKYTNLISSKTYKAAKANLKHNRRTMPICSECDKP